MTGTQIGGRAVTEQTLDDVVDETSLTAETKLWRLSMIIAAAKSIHSSLTLDRVLNAFLDIATGELGAIGGSIYLRDPENETLDVEQSRWPSEMADTERQHCLNLAREASKQCEMTEEISQDGSRTIVSLSLCDESKATIGVLQIYLNENAAIDDSDRLLLKELSHFASLSIRNAQYHEDSLAKAHLESELGVARDIQQRTLPEEMPQIPGYDVAGLNRPAEQTSGDSFDLIASPQGDLMMLLADATGHGIGPALSVTQVRSMLRLAVRLDTDLEELLKNINDQLTEDLPTGRFVTAFIGHLDSEKHQLRYHAAGQGPLILHRAAVDEFELLDPTCPPLGLFPMRTVLAPTIVDFEPGDTLALITDGVFEAENTDEQELEKEPVMKILQETSQLSCDEVIQEILGRVDDHCGSVPQADDITVLLVRRNS